MKYKVNLKIAGINYKGDGETLDKAIESLGLSWEQIKAKGVMTVSQGKSKYEHLFFMKSLKRIFANKLTRLMWARRLELLLK